MARTLLQQSREAIVAHSAHCGDHDMFEGVEGDRGRCKMRAEEEKFGGAAFTVQRSSFKF